MPEHDPVLTAERDHLSTSRSALAAMRARTGTLEITGGNRVSTEYLKATLWRRMKELEDDPEVPLFFGRLDYRAETFHIGRRHVNDTDGDPLVVDWRADISTPFYRASRTEPMGVLRRRRFGFTHGALTAYENEDLTTAGPAGHSDILASSILQGEIERPRSGPMRDIVATIQPEQDVIVRTGVDETICVQGAPGTGKTAVGLHRAAYLLYAYRDQLSRSGVLVIGPNASFLRYIGDVLPALGEIDARQTTVEELVGSRVRIAGPGPADLLKGDARMAEVLRRAVWSHVRIPAEALVVPRGAHRWRVPVYQAEELITELRDRGVRYGAGRAMLPQRLAHTVLLRMEAAGDSPDDRVQNAVARSRPVKAYVDEAWPAVDPAKLVFRLLTDAEFLAAHADGVLTNQEQEKLRWPSPPRSAGSAKWSVADATLIDEVADVVDRTPSLGHVVLDEAQDLSAMQLRAVGRRCSTGSMTVLGDIAQGTTPWATPSWSEALGHLGKDGAHLEELTAGFRVPGQVIEFAARLLPSIAPHLTPPTAVRRSRGELTVLPVPDSVTASAETVAGIVERPGSIGLIVPDALLPEAQKALQQRDLSYAVLGDADDVDAHLDLVPASLAKGLEFDHVVLVEPAAIVAGEPDERTGLRRLYVCLTRAVTSLTVLHHNPLPTVLTT